MATNLSLSELKTAVTSTWNEYLTEADKERREVKREAYEIVCHELERKRTQDLVDISRAILARLDLDAGNGGPCDAIRNDLRRAISEIVD